MKKLVSSPILLPFVMLATLVVGIKANPVQAKATLLSLYTRSDAVMVARYDKKADVGTNRVNDGFMIVTTRTSYEVSSVLKGDVEKFITIENEEFRYQVQKGNKAPQDAIFSIDGGSKNDDAPKPGDTVILFLKKEADSFVLADETDGVRKVTSADQSIIADRINELNSVFEKGSADPAKVAAWLVKCVENQSTRWDGTHELLTGFRHIEWNDQKDADIYSRIDPSVAYEKGMDAAKALDENLKTTLTQILVSSNFSPDSFKAGKLSDGDRELIVLVKRWDPATAANYLLSQLKSGAFTANENAGMMFKVSALIDDANSEKLSVRYANLTAAEANDEVSNVKTTASADPKIGVMQNFIRTADAQVNKMIAAQSN